MKIASLRIGNKELPAILAPGGAVLLENVPHARERGWTADWLGLLESGTWNEIRSWYDAGGREELGSCESIPAASCVFAPLYRRPRKIWGIGFNYAKDPRELSGEIPEPVGFLKPDTALIGPGDAINIPPQSARTTAEAELAIVIGTKCKDVPESDAPSVVAGFVPVLDMSADDIHQRNPRYLTRAKSFDTFFCFGGELHTPDEFAALPELGVACALNGEVKHRNVLGHMRYPPWQAVSFHSSVMTLLPGDILMTGTPGALVIRPGDTVECRVDGFTPLRNPVE